MRKSLFIALIAFAATSSAALAAGEPQSSQHRWQRSSQSASSEDSEPAERASVTRSRDNADRPSASFEQPRMRAERGGWAGRDSGQAATQESVSQEAAPPRSGFNSRLEAYRQAHRRDGNATDVNWGDRGTTPTTTTTTTTVREHRFGGAKPNWSAPAPGTTAQTTRHSGSRFNWSTTDWRRDRRYDWDRYRTSHRSIFRVGIYYDPYGYNYRRFDIGYSMWPSYYQSSYWIQDPWMYRLPPVYGPYRWVRYWDDALLVDTWSGEVVDVIHNFFW